jgi:enoyl-CoA hydratase/carnithine racemase
MTTDGEVMMESDGPVTTLRLNRPDALNALTSTVIDRLVELLDQVGRDPATVVVRLAATGDRAFCAGADLKEVRMLQGVEAVRAYFGGMARLVEAMERCPKPIVAAAFGYTLAGGMGLAAAADLLLAADNTVFGLPEIQIGLFPMVVMAPITRQLGRRRTLELAWSGERIDAATAERWGFVNRLVPKEELERESLRYCHQLAEKSAFILQMGKEAAGVFGNLPYGDQLRYLKEMVGLVALSEDSRAGIEAFWQSRRK